MKQWIACLMVKRVPQSVGGRNPILITMLPKLGEAFYFFGGLRGLRNNLEHYLKSLKMTALVCMESLYFNDTVCLLVLLEQ